MRRKRSAVAQWALDARRAMKTVAIRAACACSHLHKEKGEHDDAAELVVLMIDLAAAEKALKELIQDTVLQWLARNSAGLRKITIGENYYYGDRGDKTSCDDQVKALVALFDALQARRLRAPQTYGPPAVAALHGDEEALGALRAMLEELAVQLSKNGIKIGAAKKLLGDSFGEYFTTTAGDRLARGEAAKKLGKGSDRFQRKHRPSPLGGAS